MGRPKKNGRGQHLKVKLGSKKCPKCGKFLPPEKIADHILSHTMVEPLPMADEDEVPATHNQVASFIQVERELEDKVNRATAKASAYRVALKSLCQEMIALLDLEQEF